MATAGDVNGDGYADVIVGAFLHDAEAGANANRGRAYLYLGSASGLAASPAWTASGDDNGGRFGESVATAGDVNGDGYADVIVGARYHRAGGIARGRAYVYLGSAAGLDASAAWTASGGTNFVNLGVSVSTAGDVNGDGYSDVIVGASSYPIGGRAYVYLGSASGLAAGASWTASGDDNGAGLGYSVATAGDVNGDGYSDVIVGAWSHDAGAGLDANRGRAYVHLGSASGLAASAAWIATGDENDSRFGMSVATAGDVNGDGYSDVIVAARGHDAGAGADRGRAYVYLGSTSGLAAGAAWTASGDESYAEFGSSVATAGDVNGDGYSDVIVGASWHDAGAGANANRGRAYVYLGNGEAGGGVALRPQQLRSDDSAPIAPLGRAGDGLFRVATTGRTPFGRGEVTLEWQVAPLGGTFDPALNPFQSDTSWVDSGVAGASVNRSLLLAGGDGPYIWRMRTKYRISTNPFQPHGPWITPVASGLHEADLRRAPACILPDAAVWIYEVAESVPGNYPIFSFQDPNQANQRTGWNIRRSGDPSLPMGSWPIIGSDVADMDPGTPNIQYTDAAAPAGTWYYQVTAYNGVCPAEGPF